MTKVSPATIARAAVIIAAGANSAVDGAAPLPADPLSVTVKADMSAPSAGSEPASSQAAPPPEFMLRRRLAESWQILGRVAQQPPEGDWRTWLLMGGRGSGKTRAGAEWVHGLASMSPQPLRFALVAETLADAREVMIDGMSGIWQIARFRRPDFEITRRRLVWPNGSVAQIFSSEDPDSLRGPQFDYAWCDDLSFMISCTDFCASFPQGRACGRERIMRRRVLSYACVGLSVFFGACFFLNTGFPPRAPLADGNWLFAVLMVFFFAFPFAHKLEIGRFVKFEARGEQESSNQSHD